MKKLLFIFFAIVGVIANNKSSAQSLNDKIRLYEFLVECPIYKCNIIGKIIDTTLLVAPPKSKFMLVDVKQDLCVIRFTFLNKKKPNNKLNSIVPKCSPSEKVDLKILNLVEENLDSLINTFNKFLTNC